MPKKLEIKPIKLGLNAKGKAPDTSHYKKMLSRIKKNI